ncbi:MAG TPA: NADH-quinone oxidoreductase subunit J [Nitrososphaerales archaeon]|nr:NADH-quinone oxidoreductase subunit J [Nitrososphaerales archaeon]
MADLVFLAMMVVTVGSAIFALEAEEIIYGAVGLAGSLFGVAALFFLLNAPYVAVFQIAVYIGAVAVLILFTVMLVRQEKWAKEVKPTSRTRIAGIATGIAVVLALGLAVVATDLSSFDNLVNTATFVDIGQLISTGDAPVLEVLALVLAASVVGALTLSRIDKEEDSQ